jgi:hypothetical protein
VAAATATRPHRPRRAGASPSRPNCYHESTTMDGHHAPCDDQLLPCAVVAAALPLPRIVPDSSTAWRGSPSSLPSRTHVLLLRTASSDFQRGKDNQLFLPAWHAKLFSLISRPVRLACQPPASSTFLSEQTSQQYFSLRTNQHQPSATSQTNRT